MVAPARDRATTMKAIVRDKYGPPDGVELQEVVVPRRAACSLQDQGGNFQVEVISRHLVIA